MKDLSIKPELHIIHGYSILLIHLPKKTVHIECAINNGFITETKHSSGINHLLEHVLSEAWKHCNGNCYQLWNKIGVDMNASTNQTILTYYTSGLIEDTDIMLNYMIDIIEKPIFTKKSIDKEKKAVINELLEDNSKLNDFFNKHFFILEGLQYADDNQQQIKNLNHITMKDLKQVFLEYYNKNNIVFVVSGNFIKKNILNLFEHKLKKYSTSKLTPQYCFSNKNDILFLKHKSDFSEIMMGFPCIIPYNHPHYLIIPSVVLLLKDLMFDYLRAVKDLVYGIDMYTDQTICGTVVYIEVGVIHENVSTVIQSIFYLLNKFKQEYMNDDNIISIKKKYKFINYNKNLKPSNISQIYIEQYLNQIYNPKPTFYSIQDIMTKVNKINKFTIKNVINTIFDFNKCLCVYKSKKDLKLSLDKFIN